MFTVKNEPNNKRELTIIIMYKYNLFTIPRSNILCRILPITN